MMKGMILELLECEELKRRLKIGKEPCDSCQPDLLPSYIEDGAPKGCLAAHIGLCLLELKSTGIVGKVIDRDLIIAAILLHDVGKLTRGYREAPTRYPHNVYSALFILELEGLEEHKYELAISTLLHHEYYEWKKTYKRGETDILASIPYGTTELEGARVEAFIDRVKSINEQIRMDINGVLNLLRNNANLILKEPGRRLKSFRVTNVSIIAKAIVLSYILYLLDNRAAFFRKRKFEWLKNEFMKLAWKPEKLAEEILTNKSIEMGTRYVFLSLLPDYLKA